MKIVFAPVKQLRHNAQEKENCFVDNCSILICIIYFQLLSSVYNLHDCLCEPRLFATWHRPFIHFELLMQQHWWPAALEFIRHWIEFHRRSLKWWWWLCCFDLAFSRWNKCCTLLLKWNHYCSQDYFLFNLNKCQERTPTRA